MPIEVAYYAYWRRGKPLPKGAVIVSDFEAQPHGKYSQLIQLEPPRV